MTFKQAKATIKAALGEPNGYARITREEASVDYPLEVGGCETKEYVDYYVFFRIGGKCEMGRGRFLDDAVNDAVTRIEKARGTIHGDIADNDPRLDVALDRAIDAASK